LEVNRGKGDVTLVITDGKLLYAKTKFDNGKVDATNPDGVIDHLGKDVRWILTRLGGCMALTAVWRDPGKTFDPDQDAPLKNFKLGAQETVGMRNAQVVAYELPRNGQPWEASVWIDLQTQLPLKRVVEMPIGNSFTETYTTFTVDGNLDPKLFAIPK
jgi:hypothetical protein